MVARVVVHAYIKIATLDTPVMQSIKSGLATTTRILIWINDAGLQALRAAFPDAAMEPDDADDAMQILTFAWHEPEQRKRLVASLIAHDAIWCLCNV